MDPHDAALDLTCLPSVGAIDTSVLWTDIPVTRISCAEGALLDVYLDRHDRWTEKVRLVGLDGGVLADHRLLPGLARLADRLCDRAGWRRPDVFVVSDIGRRGIDGWSAVSVMSEGVPLILLGSQLVEALDTQGLAFVIGHELGHLVGYTPEWRREMSLSFLIRECMEGDRSEALRLFDARRDWTATYRQVMANARAMETRCDRLGLVLCGDLRKAANAMLTVTLRSAALARGVDLDRYLAVQLPLLSRSPEAHPLSMNAGHPFVPYRLQSLASFTKSGGLAWALDTFRR
ncbi:MAG: M48 family metalloprotease [Pseudomonadota bacterium]